MEDPFNPTHRPHITSCLGFKAIPGAATQGQAAPGNLGSEVPSSLHVAALPWATSGQVLAPASSTGVWVPRKSSEGLNYPQKGALGEIEQQLKACV